MDKNIFKDRWGSYYYKLESLLDNGVMDKLYDELKKMSKAGKKIVPDSMQVFRALRETDIDNLKCVMIGMSPYHTLKWDKPVADGLLMGCSNHKDYIAPSLDQFYHGIERELHGGLEVRWLKNGDVSYLSKQGVLMWNIGLTTEAGVAAAHTKLWEPFMKYFFEEIISVSGVPIISLGDEAHHVYRWLGPMQWHFKLKHPASASYKHTEWDTEGVFSKVNKVLKDNNNHQIQWLQYLLVEEQPF